MWYTLWFGAITLLDELGALLVVLQLCQVVVGEVGAPIDDVAARPGDCPGRGRAGAPHESRIVLDQGRNDRDMIGGDHPLTGHGLHAVGQIQGQPPRLVQRTAQQIGGRENGEILVKAGPAVAGQKEAPVGLAGETPTPPPPPRPPR